VFYLLLIYTSFIFSILCCKLSTYDGKKLCQINFMNSDRNDDSFKEFFKSSIKFYKDYISPTQLPRCRFIPSCSSYGLEAIDKFGATKGAMLTAWRIIRCNPTGGSGYDPPVWPPPSYFAGSTSKF
jgi:uncharacterized protein